MDANAVSAQANAADRANAGRTLVFCTAYADDMTVWVQRYRRWIGAVSSNGLIWDQLLIIDDGSPVLPRWDDVTIVTEGEPVPADARIVLYHFRHRLGRAGIRDYPGWFRSFCFGATHAAGGGFARVIHVESDAFIISKRFVSFVNDVTEGWIGLKLPRHEMPESAIQIIAGAALARYQEFAAHPYADFKDRNIENCIPYTHVLGQFTGDRYGQFMAHVPQEADWSVQVHPARRDDPTYFWWLGQQDRASAVPAKPASQDLYRPPDPSLQHKGANFVQMMQALIRWTDASSFFQIGQGLGVATAEVSADLVWVSPAFPAQMTLPLSRNRTVTYRMTPAAFFAQADLRWFFPLGVDIAFLDGHHLIEVLLDEFVATERNCRRHSLIVLHDCLPLNSRMAERTYREDPSENAATRSFWTGDVWKVLPILKKHRPDMEIAVLDCPPTGLVVCTCLDPASKVLDAHREGIISELDGQTPDGFGLDQLWSLFPTLDSRRMLDHPARIGEMFRLFG